MQIDCDRIQLFQRWSPLSVPVTDDSLPPHGGKELHWLSTYLRTVLPLVRSMQTAILNRPIPYSLGSLFAFWCWIGDYGKFLKSWNSQIAETAFCALRTFVPAATSDSLMAPQYGDAIE